MASGANGPSPDQLWAGRARISAAERARFGDTARRLRQEQCRTHECGTENPQARIHRIAETAFSREYIHFEILFALFFEYLSMAHTAVRLMWPQWGVVPHRCSD